jgi:hypothetical protein
MQRLLLTSSISALLLLAAAQPGHAASVSDSVSASSALAAGNAPANNSSVQTAANETAASSTDERPVVFVQHNMPPNADLSTRPRIASDLAAALREPSFAVFAAGLMFLFGMAVFALRRNWR